jgi:malonyl CoA-acyl carrier protein transacylase/NAD(P)-dependent dehydrogenase (short-subunit alcohol dehydrogenase family)/acyl carrier protein
MRAETRISDNSDGRDLGAVANFARSDEALALLVQRWAERLDDTTQPLQPLLANAALRRSHHSFRVAFAGRSHAELAREIAAWSEARARAERPLRDQRIVFVYSGMGPQWWGMARELLTEHAPSQAIAAEFDACFKALAGWSLVDELLRPESESRVTETVIAQSGNLLCQVLVTEWLRARGIAPAAVVGHSVGEVAAAWASGALSLEEAIRVGFRRASLQASTVGLGGMLAIGTSEAEASSLIEGYEGRIEIAAVNGANAVTLAGEVDALDELAGRLEVRGVFNRRLRVEVAYHSRYMDIILNDLGASLSDLSPRSPALPTWSTVTGLEAEDGAFDADYWCRNVRHPVRFRAAIEDLYSHGFRLFLEIGPHSVLGGNLRELLASAGGEGRALSTLVRGESDLRQLHDALGRLYAAGVEPDWHLINGGADARVALPTHPWLRETLWSEADACARERLAPPPGPLCGERFDHPAPTWERPVNTLYLPWVADHVVDGLVLLPGAAFVDTMLAVASQMLPGEDALCVEQVSIERPMVLEGDRTLFYRVSFDPLRKSVQIASRDEPGGPWTRHAEAQVGRVSFDAGQVPRLSEQARELDVELLYQRFRQIGLDYGPACQRISSVRVHEDQVSACLSVLADTPADVQHLIHPAQLDGAFQALLALVLEQGESTPWVPTGIDAITLRHPVEGELICQARLRGASQHEVIGDLWLMDRQGNLLAQVEGLRCVPVASAHDSMSGLLYREQFDLLAPVGDAMRVGNWLLLCEDGCARDGLGETLAQGLTAAGAVTVMPYAVGRAKGPAALGEVATAAEIRTLLEGTRADSLDGVLYLAAGRDRSPVAGRERVARVHALIGGLSRLNASARVYLATCDAQAAIAGDRVDGYAQAAIHGYGRVAHSECTALGVTLIDHDDTLASHRALLAELLANDVEDDVALRDGQRLGRRINPLDPSTVHAEALAADCTDAQAVELCVDRQGGHFWRELQQPVPQSDQALLQIRTLVQEDASEPPACGFLAQVTSGTPLLPAGTWLAGVADMHPASHLAVDPRTLIYQRVADPRPGMERLVSLWACLHAALETVLPHSGTGALLLFGADRPEAQVVRALAPLFGIERVIDASEYDPRQRGLAGRLGHAGSDPTDCAPLISSVVFADTDGLTAQPLPLAPTAQVLCLGAAREMDIAPWIRGVAAPGIHRIDPLALLRTDPERIRASLGALDPLLTDAAMMTGAPEVAADAWAKEHAPIGQCVAFDPLPAAVHADAARFDASGAWVITGGFGGFGLACAEWLASKGARELFLVGRSGATGDAVERLERLTAAGTQVHGVRADIAHAQAVDALCAEIADSEQPLVGVLHTAGVVADMAIADMGNEDLQRPMIPKIDGAWYLAEALERYALTPRHFVLFSSIAAALGNARQANYVAANVAIDAFAAWRRARGLAADSVAWGALGFGMGVSNSSLAGHFDAMGLQPLDAEQTLKGLERVLSERPGSLILADFDWVRWGGFDPFSARSPKVVHLTGKTDASGDSPLQQELAEMEPAERGEIAALLLTEALADPLRMAADRIDAEAQLADLGVDSLMAVEIQSAIKKTFGVEMSTLELLRGNTVGTLATRLLGDMGLSVATA